MRHARIVRASRHTHTKNEDEKSISPVCQFECANSACMYVYIQRICRVCMLCCAITVAIIIGCNNSALLHLRNAHNASLCAPSLPGDGSVWRRVPLAHICICAIVAIGRMFFCACAHARSRAIVHTRRAHCRCATTYASNACMHVWCRHALTCVCY